MTWLKTTGSALWVALLAAAAIFAVASAKAQKNNAKKWQGKADDIESGKLKSATLTAEAANTRAKLHDAKAKQLKEKAESRIGQIGDHDEDVKDILTRWGT